MREGQEISPAERDILIERARQEHGDGQKEKKLPSKMQMAGNLAKAVVKHVGDGLKKVDLQQYQDRLNICNDCELRMKNRCTHESCGCLLDKKAWWASEECPLDKWNGV